MLIGYGFPRPGKNRIISLARARFRKPKNPRTEATLKYSHLRLAAFLCLMASMALIQCHRIGKLGAGKYDVSDQEYSSQNYLMERKFSTQGGFEEKHVVDHCLLMEMSGNWIQKGGTLTLRYDQMRNRSTCHDSLPGWSRDSAQLEIPVRNVDGGSFESLLAASDGKPSKWIKWMKVE
jgi:hypothetical protein